MDLHEITRIAEILNKGEKAYTDDINICYDVVNWYGEHGTTIKFSEENGSIKMWKSKK